MWNYPKILKIRLGVACNWRRLAMALVGPHVRDGISESPLLLGGGGWSNSWGVDSHVNKQKMERQLLKVKIY